jgi:hypothetical protein
MTFVYKMKKKKQKFRNWKGWIVCINFFSFINKNEILIFLDEIETLVQ